MIASVGSAWMPSSASDDVRMRFRALGVGGRRHRTDQVFGVKRIPQHGQLLLSGRRGENCSPAQFGNRLEQLPRTRKRTQKRGGVDEVAGVQLFDVRAVRVGQFIAEQDADEFVT
jgi:hypothetical protein